jgi:acetyltransferase-like isoleucine patch superfamily enzyme
MTESHRPRQSHGTGHFTVADFCSLGEGVIFEPGVLVFHPENIEIGKHVYVVGTGFFP